ncbi:hypothetical protein M0R45_024514 [Rubus argutus]|uniref:Uncharacterized protein n=1 Tax=Rubus argutus TaxID=59490 RepID=A0AAW1WUH4_RUBAR
MYEGRSYMGNIRFADKVGDNVTCSFSFASETTKTSSVGQSEGRTPHALLASSAISTPSRLYPRVISLKIRCKPHTISTGSKTLVADSEENHEVLPLQQIYVEIFGPYRINTLGG